MSVDDLVGVANVGLVAVVEPPVAPGHQEHPQISVLGRKSSKSGDPGRNLSQTSGISGRSLTDNPLLDGRTEKRAVINTNSCWIKSRYDVEIKSLKLYLDVSHVSVLCCLC